MDARALIDQLAGERVRFVRLARSRTKTEADAEDVVQRAMMRAAERSPQLADAGRARAWFYRILRRAIVDHHRRASRETTDDERLPAPVCHCTLRMLGDLRPAHAEVVRRIDLEGEDPAAVANATCVS